MFALGPLVGWVRDVTDSFAITINMVALVMAVCAVSWSIEMVHTRWQNERKAAKPVGDKVQNNVNRQHA